MTTKSSLLSLGVIGDGAVTFDEYKARVQAVGVALLFVYAVIPTLILVQFHHAIICDLREKGRREESCNEKAIINKPDFILVWSSMYYLDNVGIFSFVPPFYYGAFNAVMSYLTLIVVVGLHAACFSTKKIKDRSVWSLMHFFYHLFIVIWVIIGLILAFSWSE